MIKRLTHVFFHWLPIGATVVILCGFVYAAVQQNYHQSLNDPQIELAQDAQNALLSGKQPSEVVGRAPLFDIEKSLATFVAIYDESGNPLESSASLGKNPPKPPIGVFEYAKEFGEDRVTWQPNPTTRIALVVRPVSIESGWFVASGRNMREVEAREAALAGMTLTVLFVGLIVIFLLDLLGDEYRRRMMKKGL